MEQPLKIVNYAVNGIGVWHLQRLLAVNRHIRRLAAADNCPLEIYFLTSSEAGNLLFAERFAYFKLPSLTTIAEAHLNADAFAVLARQWVGQTVALLRPDLLIADTFPQGGFAELSGVLPLARRAAFIYRPSQESQMAAAEFQAALSGYDVLLVPATPETAAVIVPATDRHKLRYCGPIMAREVVETLPRAEARQLLGLAPEETAIFLSAGGGGAEQAESQLLSAYAALQDWPGCRFVIGAGPLYRGARIYAPEVIWLALENTSELLPAMDVAVSAAGYNSFHELLFNGVPTLFWPQPKWADDQYARAQRAARAGAALMLEEPLDANALRCAVARLLEPENRSGFAAAARRLAPRNYAPEAAQVLYQLLKS